MSKARDLEQRLRFLRIDEHGRAALRSLKPFLDEELPGALDALYDQFSASPDTRAAFRDPDLADQGHRAQRRHWDGVATAGYDDRYLASIEKIARAHARTGLEPRWRLAGDAVLAEQLVRAMVRRTWPKPGLFRDRKAPTAEQVADGMAALVKALLLDADCVLSCLADDEAENQARLDQAAASEQRALTAGSIGAGLEKLCEGDLTFRLDAVLPPELEKLRADFNSAVTQWQETVSGAGRNGGAIRAGAMEIAAGADDLARRTEQQAAALQQTAAALTQITAGVRKTAAAAGQARDAVAKAKADAEHGGAVVRQAISAMSEIETSSHRVGQIVGVIDEIAFQTNLLALNAGVEAARAGDAGRGFAVVAQEVRALAQRSAEAAKEIKALIAASDAQVGSGVKLVGETGQSLERIVNRVADIDGAVHDIAVSANEQASGLQEINGAVVQIDQATRQNAAMAERAVGASQALVQQAEELGRLLRRFRGRQRESDPVRHAVSQTRPALLSDADATGQRHSQGYSTPRLRSPGGRGLSAAPAPTDDWEEF
jgi:methyl-accepting chemotaxis protein